MFIIPVILQHAFLVISNLSVLFVGIVLFQAIIETLLRAFIRVIYYLYNIVKQNMNLFMNICCLLLFIDIVYFIVLQIESMLLKNMDLHI
jgi:hypothetical protein